MDLSPLTKVGEIGESFLAGYRSLISLDLSVLTSLRLIGWGPTYECNKIESITLPNFGDNPDNRTKKSIIKPISESFCKSNNPVLQKLGTDLYMKYFINLDPNSIQLIKEISSEIFNDSMQISFPQNFNENNWYKSIWNIFSKLQTK